MKSKRCGVGANAGGSKMARNAVLQWKLFRWVRKCYVWLCSRLFVWVRIVTVWFGWAVEEACVRIIIIGKCNCTLLNLVLSHVVHLMQ